MKESPRPRHSTVVIVPPEASTSHTIYNSNEMNRTTKTKFRKQKQERTSFNSSTTGSNSDNLYKQQLYRLKMSIDSLEHRHLADDANMFDKVLLYVQSTRMKLGVWVNQPWVQLAVVLLIAINAALIGVGTFDFALEDGPVKDGLEVSDKVFLVIFTLELCLQVAFYDWRTFLDGWLIFDLIIIISSWVTFNESQVELTIIRAFRIFRAFRLITRIKILKNLVLALFSVVPRMFAIGILLLLVSYIFAVLCTNLLKNLHKQGYTDYDYFGRLDETFFTLFQIMTLDNWADIARQVMAVPSKGWTWIIFIVFVIITGFVVVNLIIAVICDAISALKEDEKAKLHGTFEDKESESGLASSSHGNEEGETEESIHPLDQVAMQLDDLENDVHELAEMHAQSLKTVEALTQQLIRARRKRGKARR